MTRVVNDSDPVGLLRGGAPDDEYETEAKDIVDAFLRVGPHQDLLTSAIQNVFDHWFSPGDVPLARSKFMASRICDAWNQISSKESSQN